MIELKYLSKTFQMKDGAVKALQNINLTIPDGAIYGIIGMSGAGKSTLVRCINLLERPTEGSVVIEKVKDAKKGVGFDAYDETYGDMIKKGIVDPTKVTRSALQNAASIASMVLTTDALVADKKEDAAAANAAAAASMGGMGGGMY